MGYGIRSELLVHLGHITKQTQEYMGHADELMTRTVYGHFLREKKLDTMSDLDLLMENG